VQSSTARRHAVTKLLMACMLHHARHAVSPEHSPKPKINPISCHAYPLHLGTHAALAQLSDTCLIELPDEDSCLMGISLHTGTAHSACKQCTPSHNATLLPKAAAALLRIFLEDAHSTAGTPHATPEHTSPPFCEQAKPRSTSLFKPSRRVRMDDWPGRTDSLRHQIAIDTRHAGT
jgi:hypothetical protein